MSIDALSWAFNLELPSSGAKLTLLALANYSNEDGEAYPSQKAMAKKTCLCERAIRTHLVTLEKLGIITRKARKRENGSYTSDLFKLKIGATITSGINSQRQILPTAENDISQRQILPTAENDISQRQILPNPAADSAYPDPSLNTTFTKEEPHTENMCEVPAKPGLAGTCCKTMMRNGVQGCNPSHPTLLALIQAGAAEQEFEQAAKTAVSKGKPSFAYAIGIVKRQREEAAKLVLHQGRMPNKQELLEESNRSATAGWIPPELRELKHAN